LETATFIEFTGAYVIVLRFEHNPRQAPGAHPLLRLSNQGIPNPLPPEFHIDSNILDIGIVVPVLAQDDLPGDLAVCFGEENRLVRIV
jgi:hypothetical protein